MDIISLIEPKDVLRRLGLMVKMARIREELTQPELAKKSGVPMATISRFERTGKAGTEAVLRIFFALKLLDSLDEYLRERLRLAKFPKSLSDDRPLTFYRVRHRKEEL